MEENTENTTAAETAEAKPNTLLNDEDIAKWQRIAYWSIFPAVLIVPAFFGMGRGLFGAGGWGIIVTVPLAVLFVFPYQLLLMILALFGTRGYLLKRTSLALFAYYSLIIITQLTFFDAGDTEESMGSVMTRIGLPEFLNEAISTVSLVAGFAVMVYLATILALDIEKARKKRAATKLRGYIGK